MGILETQELCLFEILGALERVERRVAVVERNLAVSLGAIQSRVANVDEQVRKAGCRVPSRAPRGRRCTDGGRFDGGGSRGLSWSGGGAEGPAEVLHPSLGEPSLSRCPAQGPTLQDSPAPCPAVEGAAWAATLQFRLPSFVRGGGRARGRYTSPAA